MSLNNSMFVKLMTGYLEEYQNLSTTDVSEIMEVVSTDASNVIFLKILFFIIGLIGMMGNILVICAVICSRKMRTSMTNLLITNLATADLLIMALGVPEIIQFMMNKGWRFNELLCRINRFILVTSLYGSVLTLISLCVKRYIAIIRPIKAHILCNRHRIVFVPFAYLAGLPTIFFNKVMLGHPDEPFSEIKYCVIQFPYDQDLYYLIYRVAESVLFYFFPLSVQLILYVFVSKHLFQGSDRLHRTYTVRDRNGTSMERIRKLYKLGKAL